MTPQERELISQLFERLAALENQPRDRDAERVISEGLARAPHAIYPLVQTVLVQDEALKQADARIKELEAELDGPPQQQQRQGGGFLDNMRGAIFGGREEPRGGSVPPAGSRDRDPWGQQGGGQYRDERGGPYRDERGGQYRDEPPYRAGAMGGPGGPMGGPGGPGGPMGGPGGPGGPAGGGGGSFLGTAAAVAAGAIGGGLLMSGIRGMLGGASQQQQSGPFANAFGQLSGNQSGGNPAGGQGSDELSRQAGLEDIGRGGGTRTAMSDNNEDRRAGFGSQDQDHDQDNDDDQDDDNDDQDNDSDSEDV